MKKLVAIVLTLAMVASFAGCSQQESNPDNTGDQSTTTPAGTSDAGESTESGEQTEEPGGEEDTTTEAPQGLELDIDMDQYMADSSRIYEATLGEFYETYQKANDASSVSEKFALMAIAEAKLLESGAFLPLNSQGGRFAISRVAPYTVTPCLWGNDSDRYHQYLVATELIKSEDRDEMKAHYAEVKGTGQYEAWAKQYLIDKGYTLKDEYNMAYSTDPETWDVLNTSNSADSEVLVNTYDGLLEYDIDNKQAPALAESYTVSDDGLTYTFKIRQGVKWVDSQGREVADVTADDFVAGMQHALDAQGGLEYLVQGIIVGANEYIEGEITDFEQVGVKAEDDYTLVYTLEQPTSFFITMLGYGIFAPMSRAYYTSQGGKFGEDFDSAAEDYNYGTGPDNIAYCGPYLVTNATASSMIVFNANDSYWNKDNINIHKITWYFNDSSDVTKAYNDAVAGTIDGCSLNTSTIELAKADGNFDLYSYVSNTNAVSYCGFMNLNRQAYANYNDITKAVSGMTDDMKAATNQAMQNQNFRLAIAFSIDRTKHNAQITGDDAAPFSLVNSYIPGTFVSLDEAVTVDINGTATSFPAGTNYGAIMQAQIDADGYPIKAYDATRDEGVGSSTGYDGWYNVDNAKEYFAKAVEELKADGLEISADNPIHIEMPFASNIPQYVNRANVLKQSIEAALDGNVVVDLVSCADGNEWNRATYWPSTGYLMNYTIQDNCGWGPDYGDPSTYLDTMLPDGAGYMTKALGIF